MVFPTNELRQLDSHMKRNEEWLTDLNVRAEVMKVLEGKKGVQGTGLCE